MNLTTPATAAESYNAGIDAGWTDAAFADAFGPQNFTSRPEAGMDTEQFELGYAFGVLQFTKGLYPDGASMAEFRQAMTDCGMGEF